ncbi:uncharacterized protein LOC130550249 [Triplophysa rosa]|uniref:uncharacterized protein LOC130550249 n=1 Tax=Triplophysa rosa TaxID=992332 RepID=UPI00254609BD|nr:uncharacterized protein LOC130550249 [Triplophysa rosa]
MRSPRVLNLLQWFDEPIEHVLVFEYVHPCETLEHFIESNGGRLDERQARDLIFQAVLAAKDCLDQDVFHRTIVLKNILINTTTLKIKLSDFSCGVLAVTDLDRYIAEISMVWFVGDVLYRMLYGRPPYLTAQGIVTRTLNFDSSLSGECCDFLSSCLNKNSARRASVPELVTHTWFHGVQV